jgi:cell division protein YceG involved in septum cleavage
MTTTRRAERHEHRDRPRRVSLLVLFLVLAGFAGALVMASRYYGRCRGPATGPAQDVSFTVEEGATAELVVEDLAGEGVIPCGGFVGNLLMRGTGKSAEIRAGTYSLTTGMTLDEGKYDRPRPLPAGASLEGFLWPETYRIPTRDEADAVIQRLLDQFAEETANLPWERAEQLGVTPYEIVVIASMIEKEAAVQADRPLIAGVIYNRLREGMTLGIDATLLYDDPTPDGELSTADIETDGPYNTRIRAGLPPTPIASPYLWSLRAALNPADTPYLYYVLCGEDGAHRFAETYREHQANIDVCLD